MKAKKNVKFCKLSEYAKRMGITYRTAFNRYHEGRLPGAWKDDSGHICVPIEYFYGPVSTNVTIYASVMKGIPNAKAQLEKQVQKLVDYATARGYNVLRVVKEQVELGINEQRPKLFELLADKTVKHIVVANKSNIGRFAYEYVDHMMETSSRQLECMNISGENIEDLKTDYSKAIYMMCKRVSNKKLTKRNIRTLLDALSLPDITHLLP